VAEPGFRGALALTARSVVGHALRLGCDTVGLPYLGTTSDASAAGDATGVVVLLDVETGRPGLLPHDAGAVVLLGPSHMTRRLQQALGRGADAVVTLDDGVEALSEALAAVAVGGAYVSPNAARTLLTWHRAHAQEPRATAEVVLSDRERDVLGAMVDGLSTKATARRLDIAIKTVEAHRRRLFDRLGVRSQNEVVTLALTDPRLLDPRRFPPSPEIAP
jgi:DNA-binding NarL/FixJ family response regulator